MTGTGPAFRAVGQDASIEEGSAGLEGLRQLAAVVCELADAARPIALRYFRQPISIDRKTDLSPVTLADRSIEAAIRAIVRARYPDHGIYGEEQGTERLESRFVWVIDPIDGTKSFISGNPLFGTLVAVLDRGRPILGYVEMPALREHWMAHAGLGTIFNAEPCRTSSVRRPEEARLYASPPDQYPDRDRPVFDAIRKKVAFARYGGDCYAYGLLAAGHADIVVESGLQPYDYLPVAPIVEGAGGVISDWQGNPIGLQSDGRIVAAASPMLHRWALEQIAAHRSDA